MAAQAAKIRVLPRTASLEHRYPRLTSDHRRRPSRRDAGRRVRRPAQLRVSQPGGARDPRDSREPDRAAIAFILYGRLRENALVGELVLFTALTLLALANLTRAVAPSFDGTNPRVVWIPLAAQLLGAVAFAAAPLITPRRLRSPRRSLAYASAAVAVALVAIVVFGLAAGGLSTGIDPMPSPEDARAPTISGTAGLLTVQTISIVLFAVGAVGFARRAQDSGDELLAWLALAATFAVFARVNYLLFPSVFSDWVSTGGASPRHLPCVAGRGLARLRPTGRPHSERRSSMSGRGSPSTFTTASPRILRSSPCRRGDSPTIRSRRRASPQRPRTPCSSRGR